ncbi:MAG TPA: diaminopimelate epimerase [Vicinamibacterales bacterium]|jgi:diaminopimelate epimerase|nr:diaminopimelate epimerase [Vicinamibacterales bacterium]
MTKFPGSFPFTKAHAYGNDFLYVRREAVDGRPFDALARELCNRHTGVGADGLIVFVPTPEGAAMQLFNADGGRAEVSGNGVRGLGALLLRDRPAGQSTNRVTIHTEAGAKQLTRLEGRDADARQTFRTAMGLPRDLRQIQIAAGGHSLTLVVMDFGNPQAVLLGPLPDQTRFESIGHSLERHPQFPEGTNVEFAAVEAPDTVRILIWERGVGPTTSSGTGSCAALVAAAAYGGARREADVIAPGGAQRVEWLDDSVYLTGWAEILFDGEWLRDRS